MTALVIGATGFLGRVFMRDGLPSMPCKGTGRSGEPGHVPFDLTEPGTIGGILDALDPTAVIVTAAIADVDACDRRPDLSAAVNRDGPARIAQETGARGIPMVYLSSEYVFDGQDGPYDEAATAAPSIVYGRHKAQAEALVYSANPRAIILRTSQIYDAPPYLGGFVSHLVAMLDGGQEIAISDRMLCTPTFAPDIVRLADRCLSLGRTGVFHAAGPGTMTRFEAAQRALTALGHSHDLIRRDRSIKLDRPLRCGLQVARTVAATGWHPRVLEAALAKVNRKEEA